jgi:TPR repeat protein
LAPVNAPKAVAYYQQASDRGSVAGVLRLAELYRTGNTFLPADPKRAVTYYEQAVAANDNSARKTLANMLWNGAAEIAADPPRATALLEQAIADGDASSAMVLGQLLARGAESVAPDYDGAKRAFEIAYGRGVTAASARFALAILDGPLQETHGNEAAALLKDAVKANIPGALVDLARLQVAGRIPGDAARSAIALLEPAAAAGDVSAIRYLLSLYRDGAGKALAPAHTKARDLLAKSASLLGPDTARQERILLTAASAASATSLAAMLPDYTGLVSASQVSILQRLAGSYQNAYVYLLQTWLRDHGRYDGSINGIMSASTVRSLNQLCSDADADLICSKGLLEKDATAVITNFIVRPEHKRPEA